MIYVEKTRLIEDLQPYKDLWETSNKVLYAQFDNLFDTTRGTPKRPWDQIECLENLRKETEIKVDRSLKHFDQYFLNYSRGSFTSLHKDTDKVQVTVITLIDISENLDGGDVLVMKPLSNRDIKGETRAKPSFLNPVKEEIVPEVWRLDLGESLIYTGYVKHGVTRVKKGNRLVLVSWFK